MLVHVSVDHPTAAEAAVLAKALDGTGVGFAVGPRLLARSGVAVVSMLRAFGPVLVDARLGGSGPAIAAAARVFASGGASRVTLGAGCGPSAVQTVADALSSYGASATVSIVHPEAVDEDTDLTTAGIGRGRMISRVAASLVGIAGVEILGTASDLGVVAQTAPGLGVVVTRVGDLGSAQQAAVRGAVAVVLGSGVATDAATAARFVAAAG